MTLTLICLIVAVLIATIGMFLNYEKVIKLEKELAKQPKYKIGDCLRVVNYYDNVFVSNIVKITISENGILYELSNGEGVYEDAADCSWNRILCKINK